jgi:putative heme-binding domain-containing protein
MNGVMHVVASEQDVTKVNQAAPATPIAVPPVTDARAFVQMWTVDDFKPAFAAGWERRRSLARGHDVFVTAGCVKCHGFRGEGVKSAPELGEITKKYRDVELLRQIVEPSAVILEGYENRVFELLNGDSAVGRVVGEGPDGWRIAANLQEPEKTELVRREDVKSQRPSKLSPMPTGLLVTFTREEILDLVAFLQSPAPEPKSGATPPAGGGSDQR